MRLAAGSLKAQSPADTLHITRLDELFVRIEQHGYTTALGRERGRQAHTAYLTALGNTVHPRVPVQFALTDNTELPVNFIPASVFGGPDGAFKEVQMGQRYVASLGIQPQLELFQPTAIAQVKVAKLQETGAELQTRAELQTDLQAATAVYYNLSALRQQQTFLKEQGAIADSLHRLIARRCEQGTARLQERNDALVYVLQIQDQIEQIDYQCKRQLLQLSALCRLPEGGVLSVEPASELEALPAEAPSARSAFALRRARWQAEQAKAERRVAEWAHLPSLSFVSSVSWQNNSNNRFFDADNPWINANYWGLRLNYTLGTDVQRLSALRQSRHKQALCALQIEQTEQQSHIQEQQLQNDYLKAQAQAQKTQEISALRYDTYVKYRHQFDADILPLERLLQAYTEYINAELANRNARIQARYALACIELYNRFQ